MKKIKYTEPDNYFPKELRDELLRATAKKQAKTEAERKNAEKKKKP